MKKMDFSTEGMRANERVAGFREKLRQAYFELDIQPLTQEPLEGRVSTAQVSSLLVGRIGGSSIEVERRHRNDDGPDGYFLNVQVRGTGVIEQCGRHIKLLTGQAAFVHASSDFRFHFPGDFEQLSLHIPNELMPAHKRPPTALAATKLATTPRLGATIVPRMLIAMVRAISEVDHITAPDALSIEQQLLYMLQTSFGHMSPPPAQHDAQLLNWIERKLQNPTLNLEMAAAELSTSKRSIQYAMQRHGESFSGRVRRRRIERAKLLLRDRGLRTVPIAEIAMLVGFSDVSTFCRVFRKLCGQTASQYRKVAKRAASGAGQ